MQSVESNRLTTQNDTAFFGHPRGLSTLFFTEMWERFSYYGMRALLILFMTRSAAEGGLAMDVSSAGAVYGLFTAGAYMAALPGGWIADRIIGLQRAVLLGGVLIALGNALLFLPTMVTFYPGLLLIVLGTGLLKPNVSAIVGKLYSEEDSRRDAGFSIFYMGINLGATIAPLVCGYIGQRINWRYGFGIAAIGMSLGVLQYVAGRKNLRGAGRSPAVDPSSREAQSSKRHFYIGLVALSALVVAAFAATNLGAITAKQIADISGAALLFLVIGFFSWLLSSASWSPTERAKLMVIAILFAASAVFWSIFEQAGSTLNLFALEKTDNRVLSFDVPASWYQSVNGFFIVTLAPLFAWLWISLGRRDPSSPTKFVLGLVLVGAGFVVLAAGAQVAENGVKVSPGWLLLTYLLHTMGELCLSPVGLSAMTKLAPERVAGLMMGVWFLSISVGNYMGGRMASLYEALSLPLLFGAVGAFAICAGLALGLFVKPINRLMGGVR